MADTSGGSVFRRMGLTPVINAGGTNTKHSGSRMRPEVIEAIRESSDVFLNIDELLVRAGEMIAEAIGVEAALVTSGAAGGLVLQAAAVMTGKDVARIQSLPITDWFPNELIIQRQHRFHYDHAYLMTGAKFVEVGKGRHCYPEEVEAAITPKTAGIIHLVSPFTGAGDIPLPVLAEIAHRHDLPVICDAASMVPPRENMTRYLDEGADIVSISGGKGIRGPQSTGLLIGNADLVEAARLNAAPNQAIGRPMKVSKEEIVGLVAAVEAFMAEDEAAETARFRRYCETVVDQIAEVPGIRAQVEHDRKDHPIPHAVIYFERNWRGPDGEEIHRRLMQRSPRVYLSPLGFMGEIYMDPINLQPGEIEIVAESIRDELLKASSGE
ncbi:MAG: aminotransferase class V-fold PLP-dependent enzyme [Chloroflexi bacterium]|nr:aminotransferase class V-fold PLP-dependent enzyme [Chloroflexota bacterium]